MAKVHYLDQCPADLGQQIAMLNHNAQRGAELVTLTMAAVPAPRSNITLAAGRQQPSMIPIAVAFYAIEEWQFKETFGRDYNPDEWENIQIQAVKQ